MLQLGSHSGGMNSPACSASLVARSLGHAWPAIGSVTEKIRITVLLARHRCSAQCARPGARAVARLPAGIFLALRASVLSVRAVQPLTRRQTIRARAVARLWRARHRSYQL